MKPLREWDIVDWSQVMVIGPVILFAVLLGVAAWLV